jgi:hypothetical protein
MEAYWISQAARHSRRTRENVPSLFINRSGGISMVVSAPLKKEAVQALIALDAIEKERGRLYFWNGCPVAILSHSLPRRSKGGAWYV